MAWQEPSVLLTVKDQVLWDGVRSGLPGFDSLVLQINPLLPSGSPRPETGETVL